MRNTQAILFLVLICSAASSVAENLLVKSGIEKNQFIELYTSEGCSSCPPADKWISKLKHSDMLWNDVFPVAFHVDYWDQLGWKDELADESFSDRQRQYRREGSISQVYTPGFIVDGQEWRGFFKRKMLKRTPPQYVGEITLQVKSGHLYAEFVPQVVTGENLVFHTAVLGFDIENEIHAGENAGRTLIHDFAVLAYANKNVSLSNNKFATDMAIPMSNSIKDVRRKAIVLWVSESNSQSPLQVVGNWL